MMTAVMILMLDNPVVKINLFFLSWIRLFVYLQIINGCMTLTLAEGSINANIYVEIPGFFEKT